MCWRVHYPPLGVRVEGMGVLPSAARSVAESVKLPEAPWLPTSGHHRSFFSGHVAVSQAGGHGAPWVPCGFLEQTTQTTRRNSSQTPPVPASSNGEEGRVIQEATLPVVWERRTNFKRDLDTSEMQREGHSNATDPNPSGKYTLGAKAQLP